MAVESVIAHGFFRTEKQQAEVMPISLRIVRKIVGIYLITKNIRTIFTNTHKRGGCRFETSNTPSSWGPKQRMAVS